MNLVEVMEFQLCNEMITIKEGEESNKLTGVMNVFIYVYEIT